MPGFTSNFNIEYPLPSDPMHQGAVQMRRLAETVDTALNGAGIPGPIGSAFEAPSCQVSRSSAQSIPNSVDATIFWTTTDWDSEPYGHPMMDTDGIKIQVDGIYLVTLMVPWQSNPNGRRGVKVLKNGTDVPSNSILTNAGPSADVEYVSTVTGQVPLVVGDKLYAGVWQNCGGNLNINPSFGDTRPSMGVTWLRPLP